MKKLLSLILFLSFVSSLFSANLQKTYTVNDPIYRAIDSLCREAGVIGPSSFSPVTGRVLEIALNRIDRNSLSSDLATEYDRLVATITEDYNDVTLQADFFRFDLNLRANLQFNLADYNSFVFSNGPKSYQEMLPQISGEDAVIPPPSFDRSNDTLIPYRYEMPSLTFYPEMYFGDFIFLEADFSIRNNPYRLYESSFGWLMTGVYGNFSFFGSKPSDLPGYIQYPNSSFAPDFPYKAGASIGNDYISFIIGRYPHSIGNGISGNLVIGDNFTYQELLALSLTTDYFTYNISVTRFDQQVNVPNIDNPNYTTFSRQEFTGEQQYRVVHRFDVNLWNKARVAIDLGTIYNTSFGLDPRFFYPFMNHHNYFNYTNYEEMTEFDEANNIMGLEVEITPFKGFGIAAQFVLDQAQMYFEDGDSLPAAYGALLNFKYSKNIGGGTFNAWLEGVYTSPYLYLNGKRYTDGTIEYNLDYVVGYHIQYKDSAGFSGYVYGPDSLVFSLGGEYIAPDSIWTIGGNIQYRVQGRKGGLRTGWLTNQIGIIDMGNSIIEDDPSIFMNDNITPSGGWYNAEQLFKISAYGNYCMDDYNLEIFAAGAINTYFNFDRQHGETRVYPQFSFGIKWHGLKNSWFKSGLGE